ncbi:cytochrome P450 11C1 [Narcine bancroftii]|uniref:cytochrome P450 11C1 n=1 Tax=Narcine bancroftii TaxID=1343680 RepID=UPI0038322E4B
MRGLRGRMWDIPRAGCPVASGHVSQADGGQLLPYQAIPAVGRNGWVNLYRLWRSGFSNLHLSTTRNFQDLGPIYREKLGTRESVFIYHPDDAAVLFQSEGPTPRRVILESWLAHRHHRHQKCGIFLKDGWEWWEERLVLNQVVMKPESVSRFGSLLEPVAKDFVLSIQRRLGSSGSSSPTNLLPQLMQFALESSVHLLYGERLGLLEDQVKLPSERFLWAVRNMLRSTVPLLHVPMSLARQLRLRAWRNLVESWDIIFEHADHCMNQLQKKDQQCPGVLSELLSHSQLPFDILKANATEMMVGSVDTTAHSLLFTLFELARNPELQTALSQEATRAYQQAEGDVGKLFLNTPLLRAAIKETLRLYPIGLSLQRYVVRDIVLRNYHIPAGTLVHVVLYTLGRSPEIFPDPGSYKPSRWLSSQFHQFQALAFGFGVRQCIGRRMAEAEIKLFLIHILRKFRVDTLSTADIKLLYPFIVMVDDPPLLSLRPIPRQA